MALGLTVCGAPNVAANWAGSLQKQAAEAAGERWAHTMMGAAYETRVACSDTDSDGDGYIDCTITATRRGDTQLLDVECSGALAVAGGCRIRDP